MSKPADYEKKLAEIVAKAHADPEFKKKLLADTAGTFAEFGIEAPPNFKLPDKPQHHLSDKDMSKVIHKNVCAITGTGVGGG